VDWVSITDNAGGNPMLAPSALGGPIRDAGRDVVIHLSCKDLNRNGLESEAWRLASDGFDNILALTGDATGRGVAGGAKPAFDIDSVGLLGLLGRMNAGLEIRRGGAAEPVRLGKTSFHPGCVVTNFKLCENEVVPQLLKLEMKIAAGARWVVNQIGYDSRKMAELVRWTRERGLGAVPLIGNVYVLNPGVARLFHRGQIPGVVVSNELASLCEGHGSGPDRGRAWFHELAARQVAVCRGLGFRGAYLGGIHDIADLERVLEIERGFAPGDWRAFAREIRYSRPGEFFLYPREDGNEPAGPFRSPPSPGLAVRVSRLAHAALFTPGRGLWNTGARLCANADDPRQGPAVLRALEKLGKSALFGCHDCGDCSLAETGFHCPESACAKNQRNGPCGGTRDGKCEVADVPCIWSTAYDLLKAEGREQEMLARAPVVQDQALRGTSSWANAWLGRDHLAVPRAPRADDRASGA
jgi:methylenetetrahydrofolate reductase (NADPH)